MTETEKLVKEQIDKYEKYNGDDDFEQESEAQNVIAFSKMLKVELAKELYGQEQAINVVANSMKNQIKDEKGPKSTYLFLGSPATGKTFLAELMTKHLPKYRMMKFDMTQYHQQNGGELYGYPSGWKGYGVGQLTGFVYRNPRAVIVLDNFEKCDNIIQNNLLTIFEGGRMRDNCGWDKVTDAPCNEDPDIIYNEENANYWVDFTQTIFIITTSLGKELYQDYRFKDLVKKDYIQAESMILEAIKREKKIESRGGGYQDAIVPELASRFSKAHIVLFNKLNYEAFEKIAKIVFLEYTKEFKKDYDIEFIESKNFESFLKLQILNFAPELDARRIKEKVSTNFFNRITQFMQESDLSFRNFKEIKVSISKASMMFLEDRVDPLIESEKLVRELFRKNMTLEMEDSITLKDGVITYKITSCKFRQVIRIKDFTEDGLVFDIPRVSFDDIAGHHKAKQRLREVINFFKEPKLLDSFDIDPPKGMLLYGPPGTGKTMLAKAFAKEAELPFISITGLELLKPEKTKQIFSKAREYAPAIIFIDEIDTIGKRGEGNDREIPINKLLSAMDGFSNNKDEHIFVIAATNYKENIDEAIVRPGRIEIHIEINNLDRDAREYMLQKIIKNKPTSGKFDMKKLLMHTIGFTGAQLELVGKEASYYCMRQGISAITQDILVEHIHKIKFGQKQTHLSQEQMFEEISVYEAARTVISNVLMPHITIEHVSLTPRDNHEHFVSNDYNDIEDNMTVEDFRNRISVSLAGRIAQIKKFGEVEGLDSGAANDLQQATRDAYIAIAHYGMDQEVGFVNIAGIRDVSSMKTQEIKHYYDKINSALERWMQEAKLDTVAVVNENWERIERLSKELLDKEILYEDELMGILRI